MKVLTLFEVMECSQWKLWQIAEHSFAVAVVVYVVVAAAVVVVAEKREQREGLPDIFDDSVKYLTSFFVEAETADCFAVVVGVVAVLLSIRDPVAPRKC